MDLDTSFSNLIPMQKLRLVWKPKLATPAAQDSGSFRQNHDLSGRFVRLRHDEFQHFETCIENPSWQTTVCP